MKRTNPILASTALMIFAASPVIAGLSANATTDLNFRSGPGPTFDIAGVIPADAQVDVSGCLENNEWCEITYEGQTGWAYSAYLTTPVENEPVVLYQARPSVEIETVTYENGDQVAGGTAGAGLGAAAGALLVGGPAAVAAGAIIGAATGASSAIAEETVTYVRQNPVEPVYLDGEVVVGAGVPDTVEIYQVPETTYSYVNVNGQLVLIENGSRRIVQVVR